MLDFPRHIMLELLKTKSIELGDFLENTFVPKVTLMADRDFSICLTDVVYSQVCANGSKVKLTLGDEHVSVPVKTLGDPDVFHKYYAWAYERECRFMIRISEHVQAELYTAPYMARLHLSNEALHEMKENLYCSPIYEGNCDLGTPSNLYQQVDWNI